MQSFYNCGRGNLVVLVEKQAYKSSAHLDIVGTKILEADEGIPIAGRK